jgi:hypothetical protein
VVWESANREVAPGEFATAGLQEGRSTLMRAPSPETTGTTFRLMYRSRDRVPPEDRVDELADLFARSRSNNQRRNITGALLVSGQWFVQVLEGEEEQVRFLFARIRTDARHDGVELLSEGRADERIFGRWSMARVAVDDSQLPLIAQISEVLPGESGGSTPQKSRLLEVMRAAVDEPSS